MDLGGDRSLRTARGNSTGNAPDRQTHGIRCIGGGEDAVVMAPGVRVKSRSAQYKLIAGMATLPRTLDTLNDRIVACDLCPRLRTHCTEIARVRRRAYADWEYWGRPVPSFGDPDARIMVLGLAPGAHGSNRTGRP